MSTRLKKNWIKKVPDPHGNPNCCPFFSWSKKDVECDYRWLEFPSEEMGIFWTKHALYSLDKYIYTQLRTWREKKMSTVDSFLAYGVWSRSIINSFNLGVEYMHVRLVHSFFSFFFFLAFPPTHCLNTMSHSSVLSAETWTKLILWVQPGIIFPNK